MKYSIGVDMGGTNTDLGLVTENGNIVQRRNLPTNAYTQFEPYIKDMMKVVDEMLEAQRTIDGEAVHLDGIGVGAPNGNFYTGCVDNAPNLTMKGVLKTDEEGNLNPSATLTAAELQQILEAFAEALAGE